MVLKFRHARFCPWNQRVLKVESHRSLDTPLYNPNLLRRQFSQLPSLHTAQFCLRVLLPSTFHHPGSRHVKNRTIGRLILQQTAVPP
jgi:hypothetical protein